MFLYMIVCAAASLFSARLLSTLVSVPNVIVESTHKLYICLFKQVLMFPLKTSHSLANVVIQ